MSDCSVDGCENEARRGGLCWGHHKRKDRGMPVEATMAPRPTKLARLRAAALAYAEADTDQDYDRADDNLIKSAAAARCAAIGKLTRDGMARLKAQGVHVGRPSKVDPELAAQAVAEAGSMKRAAVALLVSVRTVRRALRKRTEGHPFVP